MTAAPPIDPLFPHELFKRFLPFAREIWDSGATLLIHCNEGFSRSPSLALLVLAKHIGAVPNTDFDRGRLSQIRSARIPAHVPDLSVGINEHQ